MQQLRNNQFGFTLIEAVIVMSVFLLIMGVVITMFISVVQSQRSVLHDQDILNQMSYAQEFISKALRMAKVDPTGDCLDGNTGYSYLLTRPDISSNLYRGIKFINQSDDDACQEFYLVAPDQGNPDQLVLMSLRNSTDDQDAVPLTSTDVTLQDIKFSVNGVSATIASGITGAAKTDGVQPRITVTFDVDVGFGGQSAVRPVQTTISQRNLNVPY